MAEMSNWLAAANNQPAKSKSLHIHTSDFASGNENSKAVTTQIAILAMAGHAVHQLTNGAFLVCKYGYTYHAPTFEALQAFSRKLGVTQ